jgi:aminomethyltransferase
MGKRTPLYERHVALDGKIVDFAGFDMPVRYSGDKAEHMAVRERCGVFDVSHMGEVFVEGEGALDAVQKLFTNDATKIVDGQAMYAGMLNQRGGFIDDCVVYRFSPEKFLVCVNASNRDKDYAHIDEVVNGGMGGRATARDETDDWAQIAVQGPEAANVVADVAGDAARDVKGYHFIEGDVLGKPGIIARTGYTGEDGFELYVPADHGAAVWDAVLDSGKSCDLLPCGLGARDTLRLEAGMALYGNDIDDEHTPLEAGLSWIVKLDKRDANPDHDFIGAEALREQKAEGVVRRLRGVEMIGRGIPRHGYRVLSADGESIGEVTSGTQAPFLGKPIAMAYVAVDNAKFETPIAIEIRGKPVDAKVVKLPFYRRPKKD